MNQPWAVGSGGVAEEAAQAQHGGIREQVPLTVEKVIVTFPKMEN